MLLINLLKYNPGTAMNILCRLIAELRVYKWCLLGTAQNFASMPSLTGGKEVSYGAGAGPWAEKNV